MQPYEKLDEFFYNFFRRLRQSEQPTIRWEYLQEVEEKFKELGWREEIPIGVENILIVRLDKAGDMILTSGFIREVRANFPNARITLVVSSFVRPIVELCPYVNEILLFDADKIKKDFSAQLEAVAVFCKKNLWEKHFSIAFSPQWGSNTLSSLLMCWLSGAIVRVGFGLNPYESWLGKPSEDELKRDNFFLTQNIVTPRNVITEIEKYFYLLETVGLKVNQTHMELWFDATDFLRTQELLKDIPPTSKKVLLGIGAGDSRRKYPVEKYLVALKELAKKDLVFVITGGKSEMKDAKFIEENLSSEKVLNLVGRTTLRETEALVSQMDFYLGNGTGIMHMAAAAQVPVLALNREAADKEDDLPGVYSEVVRFMPWQTKVVILRPDHQLEECAKLGPMHGWCHADKPHCITQIDPQEIIEAFEVLEAM